MEFLAHIVWKMQHEMIWVYGQYRHLVVINADCPSGIDDRVAGNIIEIVFLFLLLCDNACLCDKSRLISLNVFDRCPYSFGIPLYSFWNILCLNVLTQMFWDLRTISSFIGDQCSLPKRN